MLYGLHEAGFDAYLVGGALRDLLTGIQPKDFDVATDATPEQIEQTFRRARIIGRRFRLVHVRQGREVIEVATFRAHTDHDDGEDADRSHHEDGRILRDNVFGSIAEDAFRRDFTVNGLYYRIADFTLHDYLGAMDDIEARCLRLVGDPQQRYREDPVRMLRAIRFAVKLGFAIERETAAPIKELAPLLADIPAARLYEEVLKLFHGGRALDTWHALRQFDLLPRLFPQAAEALGDERALLVEHALANTDRRIQADQPVTPAFLFAVVFWPSVCQAVQQHVEAGVPPGTAWPMAAREVLDAQAQTTSIPKWVRAGVRDIWQLQPRFERRTPKRAYGLLEHPKFRAAYDFLALRATAGEGDMALVKWWATFQDAAAEEQQAMLQSVPKAERGEGRKRGGRRRKGGGQAAGDSADQG